MRRRGRTAQRPTCPGRQEDASPGHLQMPGLRCEPLGSKKGRQEPAGATALLGGTAFGMGDTGARWHGRDGRAARAGMSRPGKSDRNAKRVLQYQEKPKKTHGTDMPRACSSAGACAGEVQVVALLGHHHLPSRLFSTGHMQLQSALLGRKVPGRLPRWLLRTRGRGLSCDKDAFAQDCPCLGLQTPINTATAGRSGISRPRP